VDRIRKLIQELLSDKSIWFSKYFDRKKKREIEREVYFTSSFLHRVAEVYERHGIDTTEVFLLEKDDKEGTQAKALLRVLKKFRKYPEVIKARAKGRIIIKNLDSLRKLED